MKTLRILILLTLPLLALAGCGNNSKSKTTSQNVVPDLSESALSVGGTPASGGSVTIKETATNSGTGNADASLTQFYLNASAAKGGTLLGNRMVPALAAGANSSGSTSLTLPLNLNGNYYLVACANDTGSVTETSSTNNCTSTSITIQSAILSESSLSVVGTPASGGNITISETTTNTGAGKAGTSSTRFYLNISAAKGGTLLGNRSVPALAAGANSTGSTPVTLPLNLSGAYYVVACADDDGAVSESDTTNRCASVPVTVASADLAENSTVPAAGIAGQTLQVSDTVTNLTGSGNAGASSTQFYLNTSKRKGGTLLATRNVPALAAGQTSTVQTMLTLPAAASGQNYLIVCANDTNSVWESNRTNNCVVSPVQVFQQSTVLVDSSSSIAADGPTCGTIISGVVNPACKTIAGGIASATANNASAVFLAEGSTYNEQVTISNQLTLGALGKGATLNMPSSFTKDSDNLETFVTVANGANAVITNLTLQGPINTTSCSDLIYGIYVKNATANVIGNRILNIATTNPALYGCQSGVAIRFGGQALHYAASGNISSNSISGYQKGGIVVDGVGTNVSVTGNAVTGSVAAYGVTATNGIQISRGAISTVTDNVVSNNSYGNDPCGSLADGIILYNLVTPGVTITNNQVTGNDEGIALYNDSSTASKVTITGNTVYRNYALGIHIDANSTENNVWLNAIYLNAIFDEADETGSFTSPNDWGTTDSSKGNILGPNGNNVFTQHLGAVCH